MSTLRAVQCSTLLIALASIPGASQSSFSASARDSVRSFASAGEVSVDTTFTVARNGVIDISVPSGRLVVRGSERSTAALRTNGADYRLRSSGGGVTLAMAESFERRSGVRSSSYRQTDEPEIELLVPRAVRLLINGKAADVSVSDIAGDVEIHLQSGDVRLESLGGRAIVETISGDIRAVNGVGDLRVTTVSGDLIARGIRGSIDVHTTSGTVALGVEGSASVQVEVVSGDILFDGSFADDARLQLTTHSGDVVVQLPESARGELDVTSYNGEVRGAAITLKPSREEGVRSGRNDRSTRHYEFGGGGAARITITTFSGDVSIQRGAGRRSEETRP